MLNIRWHQRLNQFQKALIQLTLAVELSKERPLSNLEEQGLIKAFEFTHELSWNVMKDFFDNQGNNSIMGSRDATRESFLRGIIINGDEWMEMIKSRNQTSHIYNEKIAHEISHKIIFYYHELFVLFEKTMLELKHAK